MEGKLIKLEESKYVLVYKEGNMALEHNPAFDGKLSLKNCEAIENGYDLDEVVEDIVKTIVPNDRGEDIWYGTSMAVGKLCFQKALELMGDKKFSRDDLMLAIITTQLSDSIDRLELIQSLQQTEWDVSFNPDEKDSDGCLILKRL